MILISVLITILLFFTIYIKQHSYTLHYHGFHSLIAINQSTYLSIFLRKEGFLFFFDVAFFNFLFIYFTKIIFTNFSPPHFPSFQTFHGLCGQNREAAAVLVYSQRERYGAIYLTLNRHHWYVRTSTLSSYLFRMYSALCMYSA